MTGLFRGAARAQLSNDWRFRIHWKSAARFGTQPIIVTLDEDGGPGWRFYPFYLAPLGWQDYFLPARSGIEPPTPYAITIIGSRNRLTVPAAIHRKTKINTGTTIYLIGQATYIEVWPARAWEKFWRDAVYDHDLPSFHFDMPPLPYEH